MLRLTPVLLCGVAAALPTGKAKNVLLDTTDRVVNWSELHEDFATNLVKHGFSEERAIARAKQIVTDLRDGDADDGLAEEHVVSSAQASSTCKAAHSDYVSARDDYLTIKENLESAKTKMTDAKAPFKCDCNIDTNFCPSPPPSPPSSPPPMGYLPTSSDGAVEVTSKYDSKVWDDGNGKVYMYNSHGGNNQKFFVEAKGDGYFLLRIKSDPSKCLDYHHENYIYMGGCHEGDNQLFYMSGGTMDGEGNAAMLHVKSQGSKCLDYNYGNGDLYMHDCHSGGNQYFYFKQ